jgi:hypothetical protein
MLSAKKQMFFAAWIAEGFDSCYAKHPLWGQVVAAARMCHHCLAFSPSLHARLVNPQNSLFQNAAATCKPSCTFDMKTADAQHSDHCTLTAVSTFDFCFQGTAPAALLVLGDRFLGVVAVNSVISPIFDFACKADLLQTAM